jgi:hypothetical protein
VDVGEVAVLPAAEEAVEVVLRLGPRARRGDEAVLVRLVLAPAAVVVERLEA